MYSGKINMKITDEKDLENLMELWNNGETMYFVGYPHGLGYSMDDMVKWYNSICKNKKFKHISIYTEDLGYCGETGYGLEENDYFLNGNCGIDIKLLPKAKGKGIAEYALREIIKEMKLYKEKYISIWVDPNKENIKAIKLYEKLGFKRKEFPQFLKDIGEDNGKCYYMELKLLDYK